jgi:Dual specificity phosphatase, catalytic domain
MKAIRFQGNVLRHTMDVSRFRRNSKGWEQDPPAYVHSRILFGSGPALTPEFVKQHNITHVINCAFNIDSPSWFQEQFPSNYKCLNAVDSPMANILDWYIDFERTMHEFLRSDGSGNVYVHCQCGMNRSGFLVLAFACRRLNMTFDRAVVNILSQRPCALTNPVYFQQVYRFSEEK